MTLYQFRIFLAIAKAGNLTKAALELHTSQPAISHQMKLFQAAFGAPLYTRTPVGIELTEAGDRLVKSIAPILELVAKLKNGCAPVPTRKASREVLRVGGTESASDHLLPAVLAQIRARHPDAALEFRTRTSDHLERMVLSASMDLAVTARAAVSADLHCEPFCRERVAMFVPANHRLAKQKKLRLADVLAEPLIVRGGKGGTGVTDRALKQLRDRGFEIKIGMCCDGPMAIKAAVAQGMGVGMVFEESLKAEVAGGEFKILKVHGVKLMGQSYIIYSKKRPLSSLTQEFIELLRAALAQRPYHAPAIVDELPARPRRALVSAV